MPWSTQRAADGARLLETLKPGLAARLRAEGGFERHVEEAASQADDVISAAAEQGSDMQAAEVEARRVFQDLLLGAAPDEADSGEEDGEDADDPYVR